MPVWNIMLNTHPKLRKHLLLKKNAFTNIITKMNDKTDTPSALKQILLKTVGQRDYSIKR